MSSAETHSETQSLSGRLTKAGLRPTRQRLALADLLYAAGDRHVTAEQLHKEAGEAGITVSLATVYNTLHHFFVEDELRLTDIPAERVGFVTLPDAPEGTEIERVDLIIRLKAKEI